MVVAPVGVPRYALQDGLEGIKLAACLERLAPGWQTHCDVLIVLQIRLQQLLLPDR